MAEWKFNSDERQALRGLSCEAQVIYLLELRVKMDFSTGIVGKGVKTSYQAWKECIGFVPDPHSPKKLTGCTRWFLRARKEELERAGLIEQIDPKPNTPMIFRLPLASLGESGLKSERSKNAQRERSVEPSVERSIKLPEVIENIDNLELERSVEHSVEHTLKNRQNALPLVSGNTLSLSDAQKIKTPRRSSAWVQRILEFYWSDFVLAFKKSANPAGELNHDEQQAFISACAKYAPATVIKKTQDHIDAYDKALKAGLSPRYTVGAKKFLEQEIFNQPVPDYEAIARVTTTKKGVYHDDKQAGTKKRRRFSEGMADAEKECERYWQQQNSVES